MCTNATCTHNDLNDSLDDLLGRDFAPAPRQAINAPADFIPAAERFNEGCPRCAGTGQTRWGVCFACKGKGSKTFKSSPASRAQNRERAANKRADRAAEAAREAADFRANNAPAIAWIERRAAQGNRFATSLNEGLAKFGSLTKGQLDKVNEILAQDAERATARKVEAEATAVKVADDRLKAAFDAAAASGLKKPRMRMAGFNFSLAPATGKNPGAIYVKANGGEYLGKVVDGRFFAVAACDDANKAQVAEVMADPAAAAKAYGIRTGECSVCGRELTKHESIDRGIGPICASKWGW